MLELLFLISFTLHNMEEGLWLPRWSKYAGKYHPRISNNEFHFALIVFTSFGYLLTFVSFMYGQSITTIEYIYTGFLLMMCLNSVFPHLLATIVLKKYAPGTMTGLLLNLPIGVVIIIKNVENGILFHKLIIVTIIILILTIASLQLLFKLGNKLIESY